MITSVPRPEYPRPRFVRQDPFWLNLNGVWDFEIDPGRSGIARKLHQPDRRLAGSITVPFAPESELSGVGNRDFLNAVWYRREFTLPEAWEGRRVLLHVGACDYETRIYMDGREVGHHIGGYTPFTVDLTAALQGRTTASLTIHAEDDVRSGAQAKGKQSHVYESTGWDYTRTTGIWQTVWLESVPDSYLADARITPDLATASVSVEVRLEGAPAPRGARLRLQAMAGAEEAACAEIPCGPAWANCTLALSQARPWSPEDPFLYDLHLTLLDADGRELDRVDSYFGLRSIQLNGYAIELNGNPLFQRLVLDQGFYPDGIYTAPSDEALRHDIELAQAMGFNGARLHQKVFEPRFLYWCDKLGYLVWGETPDWGLDVTRPEGLATFMVNWVEQVERDYSHPSIVGWIPFNEHDTRTNPESFRALYRTTRALDRTRPCIDSSGWMHVETSIYDVHDYVQDPAQFEERYRPLATGQGEVYRNLDIIARNCDYRPGQPYFVSEYGGIWWNPGQSASDPAWGYGAFPKTEEEFRQRFQGLTEVLLRHPRMCAFCYTQLTDVEQEVNGLYTYDRKPKFDPAWVRSVVTQPAAIEQSGAHLELPPVPDVAREPLIEIR